MTRSGRRKLSSQIRSASQHTPGRLRRCVRRYKFTNVPGKVIRRGANLIDQIRQAEIVLADPECLAAHSGKTATLRPAIQMSRGRSSEGGPTFSTRFGRRRLSFLSLAGYGKAEMPSPARSTPWGRSTEE